MIQKTEELTTGPNSSSCLNGSKDQLACQDEEGLNESTTESKKNKSASSSFASDVKSEHYNLTEKAQNDLN